MSQLPRVKVNSPPPPLPPPPPPPPPLPLPLLPPTGLRRRRDASDERSPAQPLAAGGGRDDAGEIRELQEQRAAAMMAEIVELQKERDVALGKVKRLEKRVKGESNNNNNNNSNNSNNNKVVSI